MSDRQRFILWITGIVGVVTVLVILIVSVAYSHVRFYENMIESGYEQTMVPGRSTPVWVQSGVSNESRDLFEAEAVGGETAP